MAQLIAYVIARDLPEEPTWQLALGPAPDPHWDASYCGSSQCHPTEYAEWTASVHAHSAVDPMVLYCVGVEQNLQGKQYPRLCAGCHDPVSARLGDTSMTSKRGLTCLGCHDVDREIRAGGNGDLQATTHDDWTSDHKARALASLETLRQPQFCGGCHQQFVPGTGLVAICDARRVSGRAVLGSPALRRLPHEAGRERPHGPPLPRRQRATSGRRSVTRPSSTEQLSEPPAPRAAHSPSALPAACSSR